MWIIVYVAMFGFSLALSLVLTLAAKRVAEYAGVLDVPGERKAHQSAIPLCGGAAIFGAVAIPVLVASALVMLSGRSGVAGSLIPEALRVYLPGARSVLPKLGVIGLGGIIIFLIGLWDDIRDLAPRIKLLGQILVAIVLIALDVRVSLFIPSYILSVLVTIAWIVVIINAFNLLDNMDGLCAGVAIVASLIFFALSAYQGHYFIAVLLSVFMGSLLGFLRYNFHPAKIFMGDAGSMFVGYFIAALSVMQTYYEPTHTGPLAVFIPLVILALPLYDTLSVIVIRISRGQSIFTADRRHFSHRLVALGMSQRGAVCALYLVTLCTGLSATFLLWAGWGGGVIIFAQVILILCVVALLEYFGEKRTGNGRDSRRNAAMG